MGSFDDTTLVASTPSGDPAPSPVPRLEPGAKFGRYELRQQLGRGGMGVVFAAHDPGLDREVALKVLRPHDAGDVRERARLLREAQAIAAVNDPHIITILDVGTQDEAVYFAMDLVDGWTLTDWIADHSPCVAELLDVFAQAGRGLQAAHDAGVVHRDFKPANVMVGRDGRVVVLDFGLSVAMDATPASGTTSSRSGGPRRSGHDEDAGTDRAGRSGGTPAYMSPEQHRERPVGIRSDQFSFCVALFEALHGQRPFAGSNRLELARTVTRGERRPPPRDSVSRRIDRVLDRGLRVNPDDRWPSMRALLDALHQARRGTGIVGRLTLVAGVGGVLAVLAADPSGSSCERDGAMDEAWSNARRDRVRLDVASADTTIAELTDYAEAWVEQRSALCARPADRHRDAALRCSDHAFDRFDATIEVLGSATAPTGTTHLVERLPRLAACDADDVHVAGVAPPEPRLAPAVADLRRQLARVMVLTDSGDVEGARTLVESVAIRSEGTDYPPVHAEARLAVGITEFVDGDYAAARRSFEAAYSLAADAHHDWVAQYAATELVALYGSPLRRPADAAAWASVARALVKRTGSLPMAMRLEQEVGNTLVLDGRVDEAEQRFRSALAIFDQRDDDPAPSVETRLLTSLAGALSRQGRDDEAEATLRRGLELGEERLPPGHPAIVAARGQLGVVLYQLDRFDEAETNMRAALAGYERHFGPDHADTLGTRMNVAHLLQLDGLYADAAAEYRAVVAGFERLFGPMDPNITGPLTSLAECEIVLGEHASARSRLARVVAIIEERGADQPALFEPLATMGELLVELEEYEPARSYLRRALTLERTEGGADPGQRVLRAEYLEAVASWELRDDRAAARARVESVLQRAQAVGERSWLPPDEVAAWLDTHRDVG